MHTQRFSIPETMRAALPAFPELRAPFPALVMACLLTACGGHSVTASSPTPPSNSTGGGDTTPGGGTTTTTGTTGTVSTVAKTADDLGSTIGSVTLPGVS